MQPFIKTHKRLKITCTRMRGEVGTLTYCVKNGDTILLTNISCKVIINLMAAMCRIARNTQKMFFKEKL